MKRLSILLLTALFLLASKTSLAQPEPLVDLPEALEIELALSALPADMRADATVYVAAANGRYKIAQQGSNGFSCLARQRGVTPGPFHGSFMPVCYGTNGGDAVFKAILDQNDLFADGKSHQEIAAIVAQRWEQGHYGQPGSGMAYMLSPFQRVKFVGQEKASPYIPHFMVYAPGLENKDVRALTPVNHMEVEAYIDVPNQPYSKIIIPMSVETRQKIAEAHRDLFAKMKPYDPIG